MTLAAQLEKLLDCLVLTVFMEFLIPKYTLNKQLILHNAFFLLIHILSLMVTGKHTLPPSYLSPKALNARHHTSFGTVF